MVLVTDWFVLGVCGAQSGATPLWIASHKGHNDAMQLLMEAKAAVDQPDKVSSAGAMQGVEWQCREV